MVVVTQGVFVYTEKEENDCWKEGNGMHYLNTDTQMILFQDMLNSKIYVDKSLLISKISPMIRTNGKYICITRPRRFGKTVNANMLGAYYTKGYDSHPLFQKLEIAETKEYETYINRYNVIHIDFSIMPDFCSDYQVYLKSIIRKLREDLAEAYPELSGKEYSGISEMLQATKDSFIFILDEWDSVFYEKYVSAENKIHFMKFLKALLKDKSYVDLAYMTGVLPIAKYSSGSELNMFWEYNFMNERTFEDQFGLTGEEVKALCEKYGTVSYEEMEWWYDGYFMSDGRHLFNPRSVNRALTDGVCGNYWTETGPMNEVADCVEHNVKAVREDIVKMVAGLSVDADLDGYSAVEQEMNTRDEILSAMVVYGFLSYYEGHLKIPNHELMEKFQKVLARDSMGELKQIVDRSREMLEATLACDENRVAEILEKVHDREIPFLEYHDENALSCVITLCYLYARKDYRIEREAKSGKGYCDYLFIPKKKEKPAIILELKVNDTPARAISQIREKNYVQKVETYKEVLLVGICYDRKKKKHRCRIERYQGNSSGKGLPVDEAFAKIREDI